MAYGARLESVLSESSQGFESPILRRSDPSVFKGFSVRRSRVTHLLAQLSPISTPFEARFSAVRRSCGTGLLRHGWLMSRLTLAVFGHESGCS